MIELYSDKKALEECIKNQNVVVAHLYNDSSDLYHQTHPCIEIYLSLTETREAVIGGKRYQMNPGDMILVPAGTGHQFMRQEDGVSERVVVYIHPEFLKGLEGWKSFNLNIRNLFKIGRDSKVSLNMPQQKSFLYLAYQLGKMEDDNRFGVERAAILEFLIFFESILCTKGAEKEKYENQTIQKILRFIDANLTGELSIESIASKFFLNSNYLCRIFKKATGTTINRYISEKRIALARTYLAAGLQVEEVCLCCGYNDYSSFYRAFLKIVGISPREYKKKAFLS
jgi:AraC-like DNA-binding protein